MERKACANPDFARAVRSPIRCFRHSVSVTAPKPSFTTCCATAESESALRLLARDGKPRKCRIVLTQPRHDARIGHSAGLISRIHQQIGAGRVYTLLGILAGFIQQAPALQAAWPP